MMTPVNGSLILFGGVDGDGNDLQDTWAWDGVSWTQRHVSGPSARNSATMATL
jgi:hypothetical protein